MRPAVILIIVFALIIGGAWLVSDRSEDAPVEDLEPEIIPTPNIDPVDCTFSSKVSYDANGAKIRLTPSTVTDNHVWTVLNPSLKTYTSSGGDPVTVPVQISTDPITVIHTITKDKHAYQASRDIVVDGRKSVELHWDNGSLKTVGFYDKYADFRYREDPKPSFRLIMDSRDQLLEDAAIYIGTFCKNMTNDEKAQTLLYFVQDCIEYETDVQSRGVDEWYKYPYETIFDGNGDCEDTALLFASLGRLIGLETALIDFEGHMAAGVVMENGSGTGYEKNGKTYWMCETAVDNGNYMIGENPLNLPLIGVIV